MTSTRLRAGLIAIGLLAVLAGRFAAVSPTTRLETFDVNRDGRPDRWQYYDAEGAMLRQSVDTNFDGRSDVQESYDGRHLVRRESDRNFDDRIDLTEEFDPVTGEHTRSVVDVDFDGRADLLVLFSHGEPVFSQWAPNRSGIEAIASFDAIAPERRGDDSLRALGDPFSSAHRLDTSSPPHVRIAAGCESRSIRVAPQRCSVVPQRARVAIAGSPPFPSRVVPPSRPRGPPTASRRAGL